MFLDLLVLLFWKNDICNAVFWEICWEIAPPPVWKKIYTYIVSLFIENTSLAPPQACSLSTICPCAYHYYIKITSNIFCVIHYCITFTAGWVSATENRMLLEWTRQQPGWMDWHSTAWITIYAVLCIIVPYRAMLHPS